jgi:hypothetical protein
MRSFLRSSRRMIPYSPWAQACGVWAHRNGCCFSFVSPQVTAPRLAIHHRLFLYCLHRVAMYRSIRGVQLTRAVGRGAWGVSVSRVLRARRGSPLAEQPLAIQFDDMPLDEACAMSRPPPMKPTLDDRLRHGMPSRSATAVRVHLRLTMTPPRMKRSAMTSAIVLGCMALFGCTSTNSGMAPPAETATPSLVAEPAPIGPPPGYVKPENYWVREKIILTSAPEPPVPATQKSPGKKAKKTKKTGKPSSSPM